jgi:hypothetical protein
MVTGCFAAPGRTTRSRRKLGPVYFIDFTLLFVVTRLLKGTYFSFVGSSFVTTILIPSQPGFALNHKCCVLSEEAANTNLVWLDLGSNSKSTTLEAVLWHVDNLLFLYMFIFSPCDVTKASWSQTNFRQMKNKFEQHRNSLMCGRTWVNHHRCSVMSDLFFDIRISGVVILSISCLPKWL